MPNQLHFLLREVKALWMEEKQQMSYHNSSKVFYKGLCAFSRRKVETHALDENTTDSGKLSSFHSPKFSGE